MGGVHDAGGVVLIMVMVMVIVAMAVAVEQFPFHAAYVQPLQRLCVPSFLLSSFGHPATSHTVATASPVGLLLTFVIVTINAVAIIVTCRIFCSILIPNAQGDWYVPRIQRKCATLF